MEKIVNILGFAGSLRKDSYNRSLLRAALEKAYQSLRPKIKVVRNGAPGMPALGKSTSPDDEGMEIPKYILNTFQ